MPEAEIRTFQDYARARGAVIETLAEVAAAAESVSVAGGGRLREAAARLRDGLFTILVLGDFKTGKSTFLNALLNQEVLPTAVTPCTAVLATIQYAPKPYVKIKHFKGEDESVSLQEFADRFCLSTREEENERFQDVEEVEIGIPAEICRDHVRIVDSPGLDESPQRTAITTSHIPRTDAAVFMMGADRLGREHEMEYLRTHILGHGLDNVFFVINRCDLIEESMDPDREWEGLRTRAWQLLSPPGSEPYRGQDLAERSIYFLSAKEAREAQKTGDAGRLEESGLPELRSKLEHFLAHDRGRVALQRPASLARETAASVRRAAEYRIELMDVSLAELDRRIAQTQPDFDRISRARAQAESVITSQRDRCRADLAVRLRQKVAELQDNMRRTVRKFDFPGADSVTGRLAASVKMEPVQRAVADQLDKHLSAEFTEWINEAGNTVQHHLEAMADQLGDSARQVRESLAEIQLKILGPEIGAKAAEQFRDPVERMTALQEALRQREFSAVLKETEDLWKGTARTFAAQFAGYLILGWLGLTNPITTIPTMVSIGLGMMLYNTNLAIDQLRDHVADVARTQLAEVPQKTQPELDRQVDAVFDGFTEAYLRAIDALVGQEWNTLKAIRDEKERQQSQSAPEKARLGSVIQEMSECVLRLEKVMTQFQG